MLYLIIYLVVSISLGTLFQLNYEFKWKVFSKIMPNLGKDLDTFAIYIYNDFNKQTEEVTAILITILWPILIPAFFLLLLLYYILTFPYRIIKFIYKNK